MSTGAPFSHVHIKPFPIRAAIDIGTAGCVSLAVGRVDAQHRAVQSAMHHQQLPIAMTYEPGFAPPSAKNRGGGISGGGVISNATMSDIRAKFHLLCGVMKRQELSGISEVAGLLSYPLCMCDNAASFAEQLKREFRVDVRVLGASFPQPLAGAPSGIGMRMADSVVTGAAPAAPPPPPSGADASLDPQRLLDGLAFDAAAAVSQCMARHRMLCVEEQERHGLIVLSGWDHHRRGDGNHKVDEAHPDVAQRVLRLEEAEFLNARPPSPSSASASDIHYQDAATGSPPGALVRHALPLTVDDVQRMLLVNFQRRHILPERMTLAHTTSPNPVQRLEWTSLVAMCEKMIAATLPTWVVDKSQAGGVICGASSNGGLLNIAARVSQQQDISLDHLETNAEHHFCGLTDVLMDAFPEPARVMASAALSAGLMRALATPRIRYLPDVSIAHGLLVAEGLWAHDRAAAIRSSLERKKWYTTARMRSFEPPRNKLFRGQPTA